MVSKEKVSEVWLHEFNADEIDCFFDNDIGELGSGSFGTVRLAYYRSHGLIAVKCFPYNGTKEEKQLLTANVYQEMQSHQEASHENIVRVFGWSGWKHCLGLVVEHCPGGNLGNLVLNVNAVVTSVLKLRIASDVAKGLSFIHNLKTSNKNKRIVHSDIKPDNVLMTEDIRCKVSDFGSARIATTTLTVSKQVVNDGSNPPPMTFVYAAPEKLKNPFAHPRCAHDVYSFGMLLYTVLARSLPHVQNKETFVEEVIKGARPDLDEIEEDESTVETNPNEQEIKRILKTVVDRCWQTEASKRPDMIRVRDQLQNLLSQQNREEIVKSVKKVSANLDICTPTTDNRRVVSLSQFLPEKGTFEVECNGSEDSDAKLEDVFANQSNQVQPKYIYMKPLIGDLSSSTATNDRTFNIHVPKSDSSGKSPAKGPCQSSTLQCQTTPSSGRTNTDQYHNESCSRGFRSYSESDAIYLEQKNVVESTNDWSHQYVHCLDLGKFKEAKKVADDLAEKFIEQDNIDGDNFFHPGNDCRNEGRLLNAILFYYVATVLYYTKNDGNKVEDFEKCLWRTQLAVYEMLYNKKNYRDIVKKHILSLMREMCHKTRGLKSIEEQQKILQEQCYQSYIHTVEQIAPKCRPSLASTEPKRLVM